MIHVDFLRTCYLTTLCVFMFFASGCNPGPEPTEYSVQLPKDYLLFCMDKECDVSYLPPKGFTLNALSLTIDDCRALPRPGECIAGISYHITRVAIHDKYLLIESDVSSNGTYQRTSLHLLDMETRVINEYATASDAFEQNGLPKDKTPNWVLPWTLPKPEPYSYF